MNRFDRRVGAAPERRTPCLALRPSPIPQGRHRLPRRGIMDRDRTSRPRVRVSRALVVLAIWMGGLAASEAPAATYYLSPVGNDGNTGSLANPWGTINKANSALRGG